MVIRWFFGQSVCVSGNVIARGNRRQERSREWGRGVNINVFMLFVVSFEPFLKVAPTQGEKVGQVKYGLRFVSFYSYGMDFVDLNFHLSTIGLGIISVKEQTPIYLVLGIIFGCLLIKRASCRFPFSTDEDESKRSFKSQAVVQNKESGA